MDRQVEPLLWAHIDSVDEQDFQQEEIQLKEHVQHITPHQYPNEVWMKESRRNLCEVNKFFKKGQKGETKPCNKLLIGKVYHVI